MHGRMDTRQICWKTHLMAFLVFIFMTSPYVSLVSTHHAYSVRPDRIFCCTYLLELTSEELQACVILTLKNSLKQIAFMSSWPS